MSEIGCRRRANPNLDYRHAGVEAGRGRTPIATAVVTRLLEEMASAMHIEVDGEDVDPALCTRANGWKTAGEKLKKGPPGNGGKAAKAPPDASCSPKTDGAERTKRPPINKGRLLKKSRMPELPRSDMKIVIRPRGGLCVSEVTRVELSRALAAAAQVAAEEAREDVICPNGHQNILVISTPRRENADRYAAVERIDVRGTAYEVNTYEAAPHGTVKGVIRGIPLEDTAMDIQEQVVQDYNPTALQANRIGRSRSVVIAFAGKKVPRYVRYGNLLTECTLYRKQIEACQACGRLGHRMDVCPDPNNKICRGCGIAKPTEDHVCEPKCGLCGGSHITADRTCKARFKTPFVVRQRRWERKQQRRQERGRSRDRRGPAGGPQRSDGSRSRTPTRSADGRRRSRSRSQSRDDERGSSRRRSELKDGVAPARGQRSRSRGRPGEQQGSATKKVGWANGSPKSLDSEFPALIPSSPSSNATTKENAEIAELKQIIAKQNAQILEQNAQIKGLMSKIDQLVAKADQGTVNDQAETNAAAEAPRKMPRRRSPPLTSSQTQAPQKQEAMEAEEAQTSETATQPPVEEQKQLTYGETIILAALKRMEDRLNTLETKHEKYAARVAAIEIRMKPTSLKKERMSRIKKAISMRKERLETAANEGNGAK